MKKLFFAIAAMFMAMTFASCGNKTQTVDAMVDSVTVDSIAADTVAIDTATVE